MLFYEEGRTLRHPRHPEGAVFIGTLSIENKDSRRSTLVNLYPEGKGIQSIHDKLRPLQTNKSFFEGGQNLVTLGLLPLRRA